MPPGPQSQASSDEAKRLQQSLGQKIFTDKPSTKDPYKPPPSEGGDEMEAAPSPAAVSGTPPSKLSSDKSPIGFMFEHREALNNMDPDLALRFADRMFQRFMLPRYKAVNRQMPLEKEEIQDLRTHFIGTLFGLDTKPLQLKGPTIEYGAAAKGLATAEAGGAGVLGGIRTIGELAEKLNKYKLDPLLSGISEGGKAASRIEGPAYEEGMTVSPGTAPYAAGIGHQIPALIAGEGAAGAIPELAVAPGMRQAPAAMRALRGGAAGATFGAVSGATQPGGHPDQDAFYGGLLGAAFPLIGKMFGSFRSRFATEAAEEASSKAAPPTATPTPKTTPAPAAAAAPKSYRDMAEKTAQEAYGKAFKDLSPAERAELPTKMKEAILAREAAKKAESTAKKEAIKAAKEGVKEQSRAEKAKEATATAATQAKKRAEGVVPMPTKTAQDAVAAKAAEENPAAAKIMSAGKDIQEAAGEKRKLGRRQGAGGPPEGTERRIVTRRVAPGTPADVLPVPRLGKTEGEKLAEEVSKTPPPKGSEPLASKIGEGRIRQSIADNPKKSEEFINANNRVQGQMIVEEGRRLLEEDAKKAAAEPKVTKVPEGKTGPKIRAKEGKPASPAQQKADAERMAAARAKSGHEKRMEGLEKHAQQLAGRYTAGSLAQVPIPELEEAVKEMPGGDIVFGGLQKLLKKNKISQEIYNESLQDWMKQQFDKPEVKPINLRTDPKHLLREENRFDPNVYTPEQMIQKGYGTLRRDPIKRT